MAWSFLRYGPCPNSAGSLHSQTKHNIPGSDYAVHRNVKIFTTVVIQGVYLGQAFYNRNGIQVLTLLYTGTILREVGKSMGSYMIISKARIEKVYQLLTNFTQSNS